MATPESPVPAEDTGYPISSVDTALRLLILLGEHSELRIADAARILGVSRSTVHRVMQMLVKHGFAAQSAGSRSYQTGPTWSIFSSNDGDARAARLAYPALAWLVAQLGETAQLLSLRPNGNAACIAAAEGTALMRAATRIGEELPSWLTAGGRILLARTDPLARARALRGAAGTSAASSPAALQQLLAAIDEAGARGWAVQRDVMEQGVGAVSVGVRVDHERWFSLDVVLPTPRLTADAQERILDCARQAAQQIEAALGSRGAQSISKENA